LYSRDGVSETISPQFAKSGIQTDLPVPSSRAKRVAIVIAAWLVPGSGHLALGRWGRGILFFLVITGTFAAGLLLDARLYWPGPADPDAFLRFDLISTLWFFAQAGSGLCYGVSYILGLGTIPHPQSATFEYGNTFTFLAGLLNYLVAHDAFDIAAGRKR
jgi:hypothetical protein